MKRPNQRVETNRRPELPLDAWWEFESTLYASPSLSVAVAHPFRWEKDESEPNPSGGAGRCRTEPAMLRHQVHDVQ